MEFWNEPAFDVPVTSEEAEHSRYDDDSLDAPCSRRAYICASCRGSTQPSTTVCNRRGKYRSLGQFYVGSTCSFVDRYIIEVI